MELKFKEENIKFFSLGTNSDLFETIDDIVKKNQQRSIRIFYANLLERCKDIWLDFKNMYDDDKTKKFYHIHVIDSIIYNLKNADLNKFKNIYNSITACTDIVKDLEKYYELNDESKNYPDIFYVGIFMIKSFEVIDSLEIYDNLYKIKKVLKLNDDDLYEILKEVMVEEDKDILDKMRKDIRNIGKGT